MVMRSTIEKRRVLASLVMVCLIVSSFVLRVSADVPSVLQDADPTFLESWQIEIEKQIELLSSAYGLDEDAKASLRTELEQRLIHEHEYEAKMNSELDELSRKAQEAGAVNDPESPEMKAVNDRFMALTQTMPLNEQQVAQWVEGRVSPAVAQEGRQRWEELLRRRSMINESTEDQNGRAAGRKSGMAGEVRNMQPRYSKEDNAPLPRGNNGDFVDAETMRRAGREYVNPADLAAAREQKGLAPGAPVPSPARTAGRPLPAAGQPGYSRSGASEPGMAGGSSGLPRPPEPQRLQKMPEDQMARPSAPAAPAPPLDDWDKYVVSVSQKYGFDNGQNSRAQSILADLRKRAYQYQLSRSEEYARAELMTDAKARGETIKRLNTPLDALFAELKQRLESLPTMAQKQRDGQPAKKK